MPQSSAEEQEWAEKTFGSIEDAGPSDFLEKAGYKLTEN
jgi:hypothetical protein